ncbi:bifunctional 2-polyprenyl-6-hydroxyphenol methylase/3-demethylubiquinol 3-O-methyltransferase UbiG [Legionella pneumophila serogroup 1]|uniref:bifunctional 2-polyprenyl-6-hydroxyphenol methylase/3-demethylubiquinol 3-O-methyltransferase UbiG n=1 Tax=Legionella pneumophila TaxID=446 RepID=UPI0007788DDF|nr:bifunctional 2-polyprenyl-6-hydroxyphenol methylase/3-demethylubiquinol 3-O-methyltransferase UbiG [Legionella pneumophila]HCC3236399.1 bifunctional 2-polyprenyl-6-hydroxyphenol methylase/3-demethylubiquinol 3-O-methyltransferase UbiG [Legionella pneumophila subsp. pneumophila]HAT8623462.1 bifunctional 2-polyprenyl-6-hydroxyphenol methylase/3-demethylubiquinol 3-O-methyltransferase UbiG [Legionella pneumophila]HAU9855816.1 bifunctional 2-polyprenyl-6-hydroxyphenol methylase/3-demethylubiquino
MNQIESTIAIEEVHKFAQLANDWWDTNGPLRTLHDINGARFEFISEHINLKGLRVLDVGCGGGILCESMAKAGAYVSGLDAEPEAIQIAKEHAHNNQLQIDYFCNPIEEYEEQGFDVITCMELLEHVQNPELVLQHCRRLLKPNGLLFLSTISRTLKAYLGAIIAAEYVLNLLPRQTHDYDKFIKPSELVKMARLYDLNLIDMKGLCYNPFLRKTTLVSDVSINYIMVLQ